MWIRSLCFSTTSCTVWAGVQQHYALFLNWKNSTIKSDLVWKSSLSECSSMSFSVSYLNSFSEYISGCAWFLEWQEVFTLFFDWLVESWFESWSKRRKQQYTSQLMKKLLVLRKRLLPNTIVCMMFSLLQMVWNFVFSNAPIMWFRMRSIMDGPMTITYRMCLCLQRMEKWLPVH